MLGYLSLASGITSFGFRLKFYNSCAQTLQTPDRCLSSKPPPVKNKNNEKTEILFVYKICSF